MKLLYRYLLLRVVGASLAATFALTAVFVIGNTFKRASELLVNNDVPFATVAELVFLLVPQVLTFTIPWGLLIAVMIVFGKASHDSELQAVFSAGIGLVPLIAPVILYSLVVTLFCFYNNAVLAPNSMSKFKYLILDLGRNNPTAFLRAEEPITRFPGYRIWIGEKSGNKVKDVHIWEVDSANLPNRAVRADEGLISADLREKTLTILLMNAREERRGEDPTKLELIQSGLRAQQLPLRVQLNDVFDSSKIEMNITIQPLADVAGKVFNLTPGDLQAMPLLTELQRRISFSFAPFTFVLIGIPLATRFHRRETSVGVIMSFFVVISYYLVVVLALALKEHASAYPELIIWLPNVAFQAIGFLLIWRANHKML